MKKSEIRNKLLILSIVFGIVLVLCPFVSAEVSAKNIYTEKNQASIIENIWVTIQEYAHTFSSSYSSIGKSEKNAALALQGKESFSNSFSKQETDSVQKTFSNMQEYALSVDKSISSFSIKGSLNLNLENSIVRIVLIDKNSNEYLVLEKYPLISDNNSLNFENYCEETCILNNIIPDHLRIYTLNSTITLDSFNYSISSDNLRGKLSTTYSEISTILNEKQESYKIQKMNENIQKTGMLWEAGRTSISELSYDDKKEIIGIDKYGELPNLEGFDYYSGGIFEFASQVEGNRGAFGSGEGGDNITDSWDWRNRHGATIPNTSYFSGDSINGWVTPVKNQSYPASCGSCWAFSAVSAVELLANLYFNQNLSLNLSEQEIVSCSGAGNCVAGSPTGALNYIRDYGVIPESCFPYEANYSSCSSPNKCSNPENIIKISGDMIPSYDENPEYYNESMVKRIIIENGSIIQRMSGDWDHAIDTIGFGKVKEGDIVYNYTNKTGIYINSSNPYVNATYWLFKNSWGTGWGENGTGYGKIILSKNETIADEYNILSYPILSTNITYTTLCRDADLDGYCNWGINPTKLGDCPVTCSLHSEKDCDDSNFTFGTFNSDYSCKANVLCKDYDDDGYADVNSTTEPSHPEWWSECTSPVIDCSIYNSSINPNATEVCNGVDDNCDGSVDEGLPSQTYYRDNDEDGYGNNSDNITSCTTPPVSYILNNQDCNDNNTGINPGAAEVCDNVDNNCDGQIDESLVNNSTCGVGACYRSVSQTCSAGSWTPSCSAGTPSTETCNNIDDDCDGSVDEGLTNTATCGVGACYRSVSQTCSAGSWTPSCTAGTPSTETCNGIDDDCDSVVDNSLTAPSQICYAGVGACRNSGIEYQTCNGASGWSSTYSGCTAVAGTAGIETCNNIDDDCDGSIDEDWINYSERSSYKNSNQQGVCSDSLQQCSDGAWTDWYSSLNMASYQSTESTCDNKDNDCDGSTDEEWQDYAERNSYKNSNQKGVCSGSLQQCSSESWIDWYSSSNIPFYESPEAVNADGKDNNCDGIIDESLNFFPNFIISAAGKAYHIFEFRLGATSCEDTLCAVADYGCYIGPLDVSAYGYGVQTGAWCYKECEGCSPYTGANIDGAFILSTGVDICNGNDKMEAFYFYEPSIGGVFYALKKVGECSI